MQNKILEYCVEAKTSTEIRQYLGIKSKSYFSKIIKPLLKTGMLEYTNKKSINAKNQKYITIYIPKNQVKNISFLR